MQPANGKLEEPAEQNCEGGQEQCEGAEEICEGAAETCEGGEEACEGGQESCEGGQETCGGGQEGDAAAQVLQCDQANCESDANLCLTTADPAASVPTATACNGSVDSGLGTGCRSSFASGDRLPLKTLTSSDRLSSATSVGPVCSPLDEQQSPMSSTSSFLMPTPTTEEMCDDWSLMSDNKSDGGDTATGIVITVVVCYRTLMMMWDYSIRCHSRIIQLLMA